MAFILLFLSLFSLVGAFLLLRSDNPYLSVGTAKSPKSSDRVSAGQSGGSGVQKSVERKDGSQSGAVDAAAADGNHKKENGEPESAPDAKPGKLGEAKPEGEQQKLGHGPKRGPKRGGAKQKSKPKPKQKNRPKRGEPARKTWAEQHGFVYIKEDEFLLGEFTRGAAASGAPVKNVATGAAYGHESRVFDLADTPVIAMNTGVPSDIVVDMRRGAGEGVDKQKGSDLVEVDTIEDFLVLATEPDAARRMLDVRVATAVEALPQNVTAVWFETEWVLAQLTPGSEPSDAIFAPLAMLADTARTFPPSSARVLSLPGGTREAVESVDVPESEGNVDEQVKRPIVARPEEPLEMPTRVTGGTRGELEEREIGADDVEAIGAGEERRVLNDGTKATRAGKPTPPPSIFGD
ncbi:hypothetical protein [Corynebacterium aquatimens]|uniref:Secreted protein n=1 Tax=Corynebacterium aquatimens TaxID=1190508 RepID=A0A931GSD8_9CORY|nr:hypothetical protein [Corynebacterium aquatimens]MBG6122953.1 hypothetical protein [Corynebacterium aquatimens]